MGRQGPVVPEVFRAYKEYGSSPLPRPEEYDTILSDQQVKLLSEVHRMYGQYSAWKLREMTHEEALGERRLPDP
jgi:uncharacterized phage-associated protein